MLVATIVGIGLFFLARFRGITETAGCFGAPMLDVRGLNPGSKLLLRHPSGNLSGCIQPVEFRSHT